jgi:hypothetical protein
MLHRCVAYAFAVLCASSAASSAVFAQTEARGVVELFTSQGCSSCPPADALLAELANDPSLVAVSVPIDIWDYLGWKDTLAVPRNTARQKAYAHARGDGQVYTPQAVINGSVHVLGSDKAAIEKALAKSRNQGAMSLAGLTLGLADGRIVVAVPEAKDGSAGGEAWLCGLVRSATIAIARGENKGRTITYRNVARRWVKLGDWSGQPKSWTVPVQSIAADDIDEAAVFVQSGTADKPRTILGAALAAVR